MSNICLEKKVKNVILNPEFLLDSRIQEKISFDVKKNNVLKPTLVSLNIKNKKD